MLDIIDVIIIVVYLVGTITIGIACRGRQKNTDDYFLAGGRMRSTFQSVLVGLSIAATLFSGISFLAYPSMAYSDGMVVLLSLVSFPIALLVLKFWFLPRLFRTGIKYPYDIIENSLGPNIRTLAAVMYMLLRIGWMAALIYAPTLALLAAANLSDNWFWPLVLIIGLSSTFYTTLGGIRGVIVTDAIQFVVIALGITLTIGFILVRLPVSLGEAYQYLQSKDLLRLFEFSLDPKKTFTLWSCLIGFTVATLSMYMADQMSLQRYLAAGQGKSADRAFTFNITGAILVIIMLVAVGLALAAWYHFVPESALPNEQDKIFPYFIATRLPVGIAGLLLAAILAATVSSMTSGINTLAATLTIDFRMRLGNRMTAEQQLRFGKIASLTIGLCATVIAGLVDRLGTIFDITQTLLGLFLGPLLTCIIVAIQRRSVNRIMLAVGMVAGVFAAGSIVWLKWSSLWIAPTAFGVSIIITLLGTLLFGANPPREKMYE
jgi:SSS family solute:Na+ symporter